MSEEESQNKTPATADQKKPAESAHVIFYPVTGRTTRCDFCNDLNTSVLQECGECHIQICYDCAATGRLEGDSKHEWVFGYRVYKDWHVPQALPSHPSPRLDEAQPPELDFLSQPDSQPGPSAASGGLSSSSSQESDRTVSPDRGHNNSGSSADNHDAKKAKSPIIHPRSSSAAGAVPNQVADGARSGQGYGADAQEGSLMSPDSIEVALKEARDTLLDSQAPFYPGWNPINGYTSRMPFQHLQDAHSAPGPSCNSNGSNKHVLNPSGKVYLYPLRAAREKFVMDRAAAMVDETIKLYQDPLAYKNPHVLSLGGRWADLVQMALNSASIGPDQQPLNPLGGPGSDDRPQPAIPAAATGAGRPRKRLPDGRPKAAAAHRYAPVPSANQPATNTTTTGAGRPRKRLPNGKPKAAAAQLSSSSASSSTAHAYAPAPATPTFTKGTTMKGALVAHDIARAASALLALRLDRGHIVGPDGSGVPVVQTNPEQVEQQQENFVSADSSGGGHGDDAEGEREKKRQRKNGGDGAASGGSTSDTVIVVAASGSGPKVGAKAGAKAT